MKKIILLLLLPFLNHLTISTTNAQINLYVASTGVDTNPCTNINAPCLTVAQAITVANLPVNATQQIIINVAAGSVAGEFTINRSNLIIRGAQANSIPGIGNRRARTAESYFQMGGPGIVINSGVNNITIEGFEYRSNASIANSVLPMISFATNAVNENIFIRRNSIVGTSSYSTPAGGANRGQPFLLKDATGSLTNLQIIENRFLGYEGSTRNVITINSAESGVIRNNLFGILSTTPYATHLDKGIVLGSVKNFSIAQNNFQGINFSAIELTGTTNAGAANNDAIVRIDSNRFERVNSELSTLGTTGITEPNIAAGILLRANLFLGDSVLIRFNDFVNNNRIAIAIPNANNNFSTSGIKIFANRFSLSNGAAENSVADLYVGSDGDIPIGSIDAEANWWGNTTSPYFPKAEPTGGIGTDILGATTTTDINKIRTYISLSSSADNNAGSAFIPNKIAISRADNVGLVQGFSAIPETWTLQIPGSGYTGTIPIVVRSFTLDPLQSNQVLPNLTLNEPNLNAPIPILTLAKPIQIAGNLTFARGKIALANNNLTLTGNIAGTPSANSFILTEGTGQLVQSVNATTKTFPVGHDVESYTPATISVLSGPFNFAARAESATDPADYIIDNNGQETVNVVGVVWQIDNQTGGSPNASLTLQWNQDDELPGFMQDGNRVSYISKYDGSAWINLEWPATEPVAAGPDIWQRTVIGINSFSPFIVAGNNAALPVNLISFDAELQNKSVLLTWNTASEKNNAYFIVERSTDSRTFAVVGKISGRGTVDYVNSYNFTDAAATQSGVSIIYYRLKQVDIDGKFNYSKVASVTLNNAAITLFPNPASQRVTVGAPGDTQVQVINAQGQTVLQKVFNTSSEIDISSLSKGMYIFRFLQKDKITSQKVSVF
jgi:hypothetical protein